MITILSNEELLKKNTKNLLYIKRKVTTYAKSLYSKYCCECCHEIQDKATQIEYSKDQTAYDDYLDRIKAILATREHIPTPARPRRATEKKMKKQKKSKTSKLQWKRNGYRKNGAA